MKKHYFEYIIDHNEYIINHILTYSRVRFFVIENVTTTNANSHFHSLFCRASVSTLWLRTLAGIVSNSAGVGFHLAGVAGMF